jgi:hypothetical protein
MKKAKQSARIGIQSVRVVLVWLEIAGSYKNIPSKCHSFRHVSMTVFFECLLKGDNTKGNPGQHP